MSKSGTAAGTVAERGVPVRDAAGMRAAGYDALQVTERSAVWLQTSPARAVARMFDDAALWDDKSGTRWTPDLVHCRLVEAGNILRRLPVPPGPRGFRTIWPEFQSDERVVALPATLEIALCEWTIDQVMRLTVTDRVVVMGFALGMSLRKIAAQLAAGIAPGVEALSKDGVARRYRVIQERLMASWNDLGVKIDRATYERRQALLERQNKK